MWRAHERDSTDRGYVSVVDDGDYDVLSRFRWCVMKNGEKAYAIRFYTDSGGRRKSQLLHRMILMPGAEFHVDHISGDTLIIEGKTFAS